MVANVTIDGTEIVKSCVEALLLENTSLGSPTRTHSQVYLADLTGMQGLWVVADRGT